MLLGICLPYTYSHCNKKYAVLSSPAAALDHYEKFSDSKTIVIKPDSLDNTYV